MSERGPTDRDAGSHVGPAGSRRWPDSVYGRHDTRDVERALDAARATASTVASGGCHGLKLLIDECVTPLLVAVAQEFGYVAHFIHHRGWGTLRDDQLLPRLLTDDLTIVTNNRTDWLGLLGEEDLHPGVIVIIENVPRAAEIEHFTRVMVAIAGLSGLVNTAVEVSADGTVRAYDLP